MFDSEPENATVVLEVNAVAGVVAGDRLVNAHDVGLVRLEGVAECTRRLVTAKYRPKFVYDLSAGERRFKIHEPGQLCSEADGTNGASEVIRNFISKLDFDRVLGFPHFDKGFKAKQAKRLLNNIERIDGNRYEAVFTLFESTAIEFLYAGELDSDTEAFTGYASLHVVNKKSCLRGTCSWPRYARIAGHFVAGLLQGPVTLTTRDHFQSVSFAAKDGVVHSLVVGTGFVPLLPFVGTNEPKKSAGLIQSGVSLVAKFVNGRKSGKIFLGVIGNRETPAFLYGDSVKKNMSMSGDDVAYLYPWYESALIGRFQDNFMKAARCRKKERLFNRLTRRNKKLLLGTRT